MEKITGFLFLFIILFLVYSFFSFRKKENKNKERKKGEEKKENEINYEKHIIAAVIASLMDGKKYKIRSIFKEKNTAGEKSVWKIAGRNYNMQRRERI